MDVAIAYCIAGLSTSALVVLWFLYVYWSVIIKVESQNALKFDIISK